ncbi:MAG: DUF1285 domain-containing protein [Sphingomonadales bacterium]|nr:DUF1285 domain-containing protein [Sphingomonadales bacterium]
MPYEPPPELAALSLAEIAALLRARKLPPVCEWQPAHTLDSEMRIAADGRWFHQGGEIRRPAMVRAFSSLLTRDATGQHWLVTPAERQSIAVEDAAFIAVDVQPRDDALVFRLNTDEFVIAGPDHPIVARGDADTPALYVAVRNGLEARLNRSTYGQLADLALESGNLSVTSQGVAFALVPA